MTPILSANGSSLTITPETQGCISYRRLTITAPLPDGRTTSLSVLLDDEQAGRARGEMAGDGSPDLAAKHCGAAPCTMTDPCVCSCGPCKGARAYDRDSPDLAAIRARAEGAPERLVLHEDTDPETGAVRWNQILMPADEVRFFAYERADLYREGVWRNRSEFQAKQIDEARATIARLEGELAEIAVMNRNAPDEKALGKLLVRYRQDRDTACQQLASATAEVERLRAKYESDGGTGR